MILYHSLREASACLLVLFLRAIPGPQSVERAAIAASLFYFHNNSHHEAVATKTTRQYERIEK